MLNILDFNFGDLLLKLTDGLGGLVDFLLKGFEFIYIIITFIPPPFSYHLYGAVAIIVVLISLKVVRG